MLHRGSIKDYVALFVLFLVVRWKRHYHQVGKLKVWNIDDNARSIRYTRVVGCRHVCLSDGFTALSLRWCGQCPAVPTYVHRWKPQSLTWFSWNKTCQAACDFPRIYSETKLSLKWLMVHLSAEGNFFFNDWNKEETSPPRKAFKIHVRLSPICVCVPFKMRPSVRGWMEMGHSLLTGVHTDALSCRLLVHVAVSNFVW